VRRLGPLDKPLALILKPLWVVCFALSVKSQIEGGGYGLLELSVENAGSHPALREEFWPGYGTYRRPRTVLSWLQRIAATERPK
jgi:hypothetical protein